MIKGTTSPVVVDNRIVQDAKPHVLLLSLPEGQYERCGYHNGLTSCSKRATHYVEHYRPALWNGEARAFFRQEATCEYHGRVLRSGWHEFYLDCVTRAQEAIPESGQRIIHLEWKIQTAREMSQAEWDKRQAGKSESQRNREAMISWWESRIEAIKNNRERRLERIQKAEAFYRDLVAQEVALS